MLNLVDPQGTIVQGVAPFTFFGNRGVVHKGDRIVKEYQNLEWIYCSTKGLSTPKEFMREGLYTELFFLDEATALAAGHRPCGRCQSHRLTEFVSAWQGVIDPDATLAEIDTLLHSVRIDTSGSKSIYREDSSSLPDGVMIKEPNHGQPLLLTNGHVYPWTPQGYGVRMPRPSGAVEVLTPGPVVKMIHAGFEVGTLNPLLSW